MQLASYLEGHPLIWMNFLHLHLNLNAAADDDDDLTEELDFDCVVAVFWYLLFRLLCLFLVMPWLSL